VVLEHVARRVGRGEDFDVEALEQRPRPELRRTEFFSDLLVEPWRRLGREAVPNAEYFM